MTLPLGVPHRQVVFAIPKMASPFFKYRSSLLGDLCMCGVTTITKYMETCTGSHLMLGVVAVNQAFGGRLNSHPHLHFLVTEGGKVHGQANPGLEPAGPR